MKPKLFNKTIMTAFAYLRRIFRHILLHMKRVLESVILVLLVACSQRHEATFQNSSASIDSSSMVRLIKGPAYLTSLQFKNDYPTHETANKLYDAILFQRACYAYLLSFPVVVRNNHQSLPPAGFHYWQMLSNMVDNEKLSDDATRFADIIKAFGIEKGKPFNPTLQQKVLLTEAAEIGFRMVQVIGLRHGDSSDTYGTTKWKLASQKTSKASWRTPSNDEEIAASLQEIFLSNEVIGPGSSSAYLFSAEDKDGQWLEGAKYYQLHIPKNIPANKFWSITVLDNTTWNVIHNNEPRSSFNSKQPTYLSNADGSVDVFFGPIAPEGEGTNWIRTLPDKGWFAYLRFSDATSTFNNKSWPLGDFEEVSEKVWKGGSNRQ